jgi:general transcription factor 3C polypeptide 3 (transcription factor C subunit 4)
MIHLTIGLAYIHHALKRQTENRQHAILQGFTFLFTYYDVRKVSEHQDQRIEANYNIARAYHMLGITNLAIPYYWKVLGEESKGKGRVGEASKADLPPMLLEAAFNLQGIYRTSGNLDLAKAVTEEWLVI